MSRLLFWAVCCPKMIPLSPLSPYVRAAGYPAGHVLVRQGRPFQNLLLILSGAVETSFFSETGRKKILTINRGICFFVRLGQLTAAFTP
jgi:CRP-like cAMP-binding protein